MSDSSLHAKEHYNYNYPRRMSTPTHPVEGDFLSLSTEEALFGLLFGWMALWAFKQLRAMLAYYTELKELAGEEKGEAVGVAIGDEDSTARSEEEEHEEEGAGDGEGAKEGEEEVAELEEEEDTDYAFVRRPTNGEGKKKD
jgi:hypothetical protein